MKCIAFMFGHMSNYKLLLTRDNLKSDEFLYFVTAQRNVKKPITTVRPCSINQD